MSKLWSFLGWVVATVIAVTILLAIIEPYLWIIATVFVVVVLGVIGFRIWKYLTARRSHY